MRKFHKDAVTGIQKHNQRERKDSKMMGLKDN
jgi:hypothetical protein